MNNQLKQYIKSQANERWDNKTLQNYQRYFLMLEESLIKKAKIYQTNLLKDILLSSKWDFVKSYVLWWPKAMKEEDDKLFMILENEHVALKARQQQGYSDHLDGMLFDWNQ